MGDYTEIVFRAEVDAEAYQVMRALSDWALNDESPITMPDHPFFAKESAALVFRGASAYFPGGNYFDAGKQDGPHYYVSFRADLKNYDGEIEAFFDWVAPHVVCCEGFVGYSIADGYQEWPTLYAAKGGKVVTLEPGKATA